MKPIGATHLREIKTMLKQGKPLKEIARKSRTGIERVKEVASGKYGKTKSKYFEHDKNVFI